ncbi:MAG: nicotinate-nucleotide adenylyltransferase [Proteobacteria bacterium]|nr:nicotinate-nucleotide adenylyltransferase [Pseudomonadota bacterium]MBU1687290.1 nicotinate-nucleotide adenylyltransferase [Pseudomonadota bacterium]
MSYFRLADFDGQRLGLLGGTFDPVHCGHLAVAEHVRTTLALEKVCLVPAALPPHKGADALTPFHHRFRMLELALADHPDLLLSDIEAQRSGPSYSVDTLTELRRQLGNTIRFFFILGFDAFLEITTWKAYHRLIGLADIVVLNRSHSSWQSAEAIVRGLGSFVYDQYFEAWVCPGVSGRIHFVSMEPVEISSTEIRGHGEELEHVAGRVPAVVFDYIRANWLYTRQ